MDEVAYITAIRFSKKKMVTVAAEKIQFLFPIEAGAIVEVVGKVEKVGSVKIMIQVEILAQDMITGIITTATRAMFTFATVDEANRPIPIELKKHVDEISSIVS